MSHSWLKVGCNTLAIGFSKKERSNINAECNSNCINTFLLIGRRFYAHRICLLASSDAFRAMFDGGYRVSVNYSIALVAFIYYFPLLWLCES